MPLASFDGQEFKQRLHLAQKVTHSTSHASTFSEIGLGFHNSFTFGFVVADRGLCFGGDLCWHPRGGHEEVQAKQLLFRHTCAHEILKFDDSAVEQR
jgi:hypothetical protein